MTPNGIAPGRERIVALWLYIVAALVFCMIILGGLTRLTESGLSMVDWKPIMGSVPPLNDADWQKRFAQYKEFPEYVMENAGMTLDEFKFIFLMEYGHRMLGRLIGLVFALPLFFFWIRRWIGPPMIGHGLLLLFLGGLQGVIGWYMVKSGLVDVPRVAQERLTLHLITAILVLTLCLWRAFEITVPNAEQTDATRLAGLKNKVNWLLLALGVQIATGGFVAGLRAGAMYNTFPTMNGFWLPPGLWDASLGLANLTDNPTLLQLIHRCGAYAVTALTLHFFIRHGLKFRGRRLIWASWLTAILLAAQVSLGVSVLLLGVPVSLASMHQGVAILLWCSVVFVFHQCVASRRLARPKPDETGKPASR